jgi:GGDEF domain-containing protein
MNDIEPRRYLSSLTGIYNYEIFEVIFNHELARSQRYISPLTLLHISVQVRDTSSGAKERAGVLMADLLNRSLRISDVPALINDDYLVLLPNTDEMSGGNLAERILINLKSSQNLTPEKLFRLSAYIGLTAHAGGPGTSSKLLLAEASVAVEEALVRQAHTFIAFASLGLAPTAPGNK